MARFGSLCGMRGAAAADRAVELAAPAIVIIQNDSGLPNAGHSSWSLLGRGRPMSNIRRRAFITLLGGAAAE
jgi:hypothetical protein